MSLAQWAGQTLAAAAVTDMWESARRKFILLFGRGDSKRAKAAERWLAETHEQLAATQDADLERAGAAQAQRWEDRFADLLDEDPSIEADLRGLVQEIHAQLPAGTISTADHSLAAGGDLSVDGSVNIADRGGVVARDIHGSISTNPPSPGSAKG